MDEIRRIEAQSGTARIKFGSMANNPDGNVSHLHPNFSSFSFRQLFFVFNLIFFASIIICLKLIALFGFI